MLQFSKYKQVVVAFALIMLCGAAFAERIHTLKEPMPRDMGHYAVVAHEMLQGKHLYGDLFAQKPPLIYWIYMLGEMLCGYSENSLFLISSLGACFVILGVYQLGKIVRNSRITGLYAAAIFTIICGDLNMHGSHPNPEVFMNGFLVWGFVYLIRAIQPAHLMRDSFAASCFYFLAFLCKINTILVPLLLLAANILIYRKSPELFKRAVTIAKNAAIVFCLGSALLCLYFAFKGDLGDFIYEMISFNQAYAGNLFANLTSAFTLDHLIPASLHFGVPIAVVIILGISVSRNTQRKILWPLYTAWVIGTFISIALPGRYYYQYYQLWLPVLAVSAAWAVESLFTSRLKNCRLHASILAMLVLIWTARHEIRFYFMTPNEWSSNVKNSGDFRLNANQFAVNLNNILLPEEVYFDASVDPEVYVISKREMPSGIHYADPTVMGPRANELGEKLLNTLKRKPPELITVIPTYMINERIKLWISRNYERIPTADDGCPFNLWFRKNGRLAGEVRSRINSRTWDWK